MYDSGEVQFYEIVDITLKGQKPKKAYRLIHFCNYEERTVGITRYSVAKQYDCEIDYLLRIPDTHIIEMTGKQVVALLRPYAYVDNRVYKIYQVQHSKNEKDLRIADITLQRYEELNANEVIRNCEHTCNN